MANDIGREKKRWQKETVAGAIKKIGERKGDFTTSSEPGSGIGRVVGDGAVPDCRIGLVAANATTNLPYRVFCNRAILNYRISAIPTINASTIPNLAKRPISCQL